MMQLVLEMADPKTDSSSHPIDLVEIVSRADCQATIRLGSPPMAELLGLNARQTLIGQLAMTFSDIEADMPS